MERARLEALYRKHGRMVFRRARSLLGGDVQAAHDAVQDIFLRALGASAEFEDAVSPVAWLCKVTTNHCLNRLRDAHRRRELLDIHAPTPEESARATAPAAEPRLAVTELLRRVPEELGEIAIYYYLDQMNQDEIAELLGVSRRTVGHRLEEFHAAVAALFPASVEVSA